MSSKANRLRSLQSFLHHNRILISIVGMLTVIGVSTFFCLSAYADILPNLPDMSIIICFEKDGEPHDKPVDFTITCYGPHPYYQEPEEEELFEYFSMSGTCDHYRCKILFPQRPWFDEVTYCDCDGETQGQKFTSENDSYFLCLQRPFGMMLCELTFDIPTSSDLTDAAADGETSGPETDEDNDGGCFIATLLQP